MSKLSLKLPDADMDELNFEGIGCFECDEQDPPPKDAAKRTFRAYEIDDVRHIWWRVICVNDAYPGTAHCEHSYLGPTGHIERMNAWCAPLALAAHVAARAAALTCLARAAVWAVRFRVFRRAGRTCSPQWSTSPTARSAP